jgi:hypothetical protein
MMWNSARAWGYATGDWFENVALPEYVKAGGGDWDVRLGELCALHVGEIKFSRGILVVRCASWQGHVGTTKRKKPREF